jgi:hypothetical protein
LNSIPYSLYCCCCDGGGWPCWIGAVPMTGWPSDSFAVVVVAVVVEEEEVDGRF